MEFFVTFGQRYARENHPSFPPAHPDGWAVVEAPDWDSARGIVVEELGSDWSGLYGKEDFMTDAAERYPRGKVGMIPAAALSEENSSSNMETVWSGDVGDVSCRVERSLDDPGHFEIRDNSDDRLIDTCDVFDSFEAESYGESDFRSLAEDAL